MAEMTQIVLDLVGMVDRYAVGQVTALFGIDYKCRFCGTERALKSELNMLTNTPPTRSND